jgi:DNA replicative helicase MCM subunit Mcm2 (Cdc46/Mcm family)
LKKYISFVKS